MSNIIKPDVKDSWKHQSKVYLLEFFIKIFGL